MRNSSRNSRFQMLGKIGSSSLASSIDGALATASSSTLTLNARCEGRGKRFQAGKPTVEGPKRRRQRQRQRPRQRRLTLFWPRRKTGRWRKANGLSSRSSPALFRRRELFACNFLQSQLQLQLQLQLELRLQLFSPRVHSSWVSRSCRK